MRQDTRAVAGAAVRRTGDGLVVGVRRSGLGALKAAAAAVLAWVLAGWLYPTGVGYYAPLVAVLSVLPTVVGTLRDSLQRLVAIGLGLGLGFVVAATVGLHWWSLGALLGICSLLSTWSRLGEEGVQVPVGALFVLLLAEEPLDYTTDLLVEGVIGAVVAAAVHLVVLPPLHLGPADRALADLRQAMGDLLDDMSADVGGEWPPESPGWLRRAGEISDRLGAAREAVRQGGESARLNPRARRYARVLPEQREAYAGLEHLSLVVRDLAGVLEEAADRGNGQLSLNDAFRPDLAEAMHSLADALTAYGRPDESAEAAAERRPVDVAAEQIEALRGRAEDWQVLELPTLLAEGAVITQLGRAVRILQQAPLHGPHGSRGPSR